MKITNIFLGLGPASSKYPCPWCEISKDEFINFNRPSMEMKLRDISSIRENVSKYQVAVSEHQGKKKLSSALFYSCEKMPLVHQDTDNTTLTLDLVPPMELHLMLGVVNDLYDHLDKQLEENNCPITANDWSAPLGLKRLHYHGGQFNGNQCKKLLSNTKILEETLLLRLEHMKLENLFCKF